MLHNKFQASDESGSEEEDFWIFFYVFLWFEPRTPWLRVILDPAALIWTSLVKDHCAMLHIKFKAFEPSGSEKEIFEYSNVFLWFEPRTPWQGPS